MWKGCGRSGYGDQAILGDYDDWDGFYKSKTVYILEPRLAGKKYIDRLGSIDY